jgi:hypothetical protein
MEPSLRGQCADREVCRADQFQTMLFSEFHRIPFEPSRYFGESLWSTRCDGYARRRLFEKKECWKTLAVCQVYADKIHTVSVQARTCRRTGREVRGGRRFGFDGVAGRLTASSLQASDLHALFIKMGH